MNNPTAYTENVFCLKAYRTLKECKKLFTGYDTRVNNMDGVTFSEELERYRKEAENFPRHLLTVVKGEILMNAAKKAPISDELKDFSSKEAVRLKAEVSSRLHESFSYLRQK